MIAAAVTVSGFGSHSVNAISSLKIQPLLYEEQLQKGEVKKGFVDISNPTGQQVTVKTSVEAFRQIDNKGNLEFFESDEVTAGITPDYKSFTLKPREAQRMVFQIDGNKLPSGDVFGALFFTTKPVGSSVKQSVRVGTLFVLENGTPGSRKAEVTELEVPFLHIGSFVKGKYAIKNQAKSGEATGFTPRVDIQASPFGATKSQNSSLLFAGRERDNVFTYETQLFGLYRLSASYKDSSQSRWVLLLPVWSIIVAIAVLLLTVLVPLLIKIRKNPTKHSDNSKIYATLKHIKKKE